MTDQELRTLARDWCEGRVCFSTHVPENLIQMVFMPLFFMTNEARQKMIDDGVYALYGKMEDAESRSINGYPIFMTMYSITEANFLKVKEYAKQYAALQKQFEQGASA